jgi:hypothetical protein
MSRYPYPQHFCLTSPNLNLYMSIDLKKLKSVNAKYQTKIGF